MSEIPGNENTNEAKSEENAEESKKKPESISELTRWLSKLGDPEKGEDSTE